MSQGLDNKKIEHKNVIFSYLSVLTYVFGLNETFL